MKFVFIFVFPLMSLAAEKPVKSKAYSIQSPKGQALHLQMMSMVQNMNIQSRMQPIQQSQDKKSQQDKIHSNKKNN